MVMSEGRVFNANEFRGAASSVMAPRAVQLFSSLTHPVIFHHALIPVKKRRPPTIALALLFILSPLSVDSSHSRASSRGVLCGNHFLAGF